MPKPFVKLSITEFEDLVATFDFSRQIDAIHMHHTWRPNHSQYRGLPTINSMWEYHTQSNGWSDIAQHISIAPDGSIWSGRNWNTPPASAVGYNGNTKSGPFMFEMIGDFDNGQDSFTDPQKSAVIRVIAALLNRFSLPIGALRFHNHMTDQKSCPGTAIDYQAFSKEVQGFMSSRSTAKTRRGGSPSEAVKELGEAMDLVEEVDLSAPEFLSDHLHFPEERFSTRGPGGSSSSVKRDAHLINIKDGRLSNSGAMSTTPESLAAIFEDHLPTALEAAKLENRPLRIMFFAHGGLNDEKGSIETALSRIDWWLGNGVYPIFFIWETGLLETFQQMLERKVREMWGSIGGVFGRRGFWDFVADKATDPAVEKIARSIGGESVWGQMKNSAQRAAEPNTGGAWLTAGHLKTFLGTAGNHPVELHAIGHSAGSIFHAHFLPAVKAALGANGPTIKTLHYLAPAIRVDLFKQKVIPMLGNGIDRLALFTMTDEKEREDTCAKVYRKSLLYLIHHALEHENQSPLVGLQKSIRSDKTLLSLFEPSQPGRAEVVWSPVNGGPRYSSKSLTHGGFDDEPLTMNSVCRRIVGRDKITEYNVKPRGITADGFEPSDEQIALGILTDHALKLQAASGAAPAAEIGGPSVSPITPPNIYIPTRGGTKRALCVGINEYPTPEDRLSGCVSDAKNWASFLSSVGFTPQLLLDRDATHRNIINSIKELVETSKAGDVIAIQFAGHGTQVADLNGDESPNKDDQCLCCHDFRAGTIILDDDIGEIFARTPKGVNLTAILDSCHSGTATRKHIMQPSLVTLPQDAVRRQARSDAPLNDAHRAYRESLSKDLRSAQRAANNPYDSAIDVLFSAALPHQYAHEINGSGVFTNTALAILGGPNAPATNADFIRAVQDRFPESFRSDQQPQIYHAKDTDKNPFLGGLR